MSSEPTPSPICPPGFVKVDITIPPYYVCAPTRAVTTTTRPVVTTNCYTAYAPTIIIYNTQLPLVYQVVAFTFDIYNTPVKVPKYVLTKKARRKGAELIEVNASTILDALSRLLVISTENSFGRVPVASVKVSKVFSPLCPRSYVLLKIVGTVTVRAVIRPVAISGSDAVLTTFVSAGILGNIHTPTRATSFQVVEVPVQFITSPEQLTAFIQTLTGK
ncbi:hypothetical protein [Deltalipothrixvirus pozzuoliense]|uniref:Uncharacterized protein ORF217b n=1 Tax=Acidianus filamentous virus 2 (isolate Italy/Pozzuoli) TaxID=654910 RepID=Y217B_AFV2P|nr:hypothetical protein AFV2_gp21 [Acidianus filamentous virus 2]Q573E8.1 RecName: Full=Uncharacterized protein ORF217b [Acidianus filamentous virus 2 (isolate Pozzuoli)]CAH69408.1 hypothetical protein [Acidianus filamentous virus 2]